MDGDDLSYAGGTPGFYDDASYTGEMPDAGSLTRFASLDYYRDQIRRFQVALNELDATAVAMREFASLAIPPAEYDAAVAWLTDYEENRGRAIATAEAINFAANAANAVGIRMPVVSWSQRGGLGNPLMIAGVAAAIGAGAWFLSYAIDKISEAKRITTLRDILASLPEDQRAAALKVEQEIELAKTRAENPISAIANAVKWIALAAAGYFAYRAFADRG